MSRSIGIVTAEVISSALVVNNQVQGPIRTFPGDDDSIEDLITYPADNLIQKICEILESTPGHDSVDCIGLGFPGLIRDNIVEESPNYRQMKGVRLGDAVKTALAAKGIDVSITVSNDADVVAAGIAASRGQLDRLIRVWTLGNGIGFGHYPSGTSVWRAAIRSLRSIQKRSTAVAGERDISKGSWAIARCACDSSISSRKRFSQMQTKAIRAALNS